MNFTLQKDIFISFFRSGMLGYGGGPSTIPLYHKEVVDTYKWMTEEEFGDVLAIANTLPGPLATKMAGYIGYRVGGLMGVVSAIIATVLPTVLIMIGLISFLFKFRGSSIVQGMTKAIAPVVGVMILMLTASFVRNSVRDLGWVVVLILSGVSIFIYVILDWHPAIIIGALILFSLFSKGSKKEKEA
ncbi:chromate transporter [Bacillaceae bacterium W0354]